MSRPRYPHFASSLLITLLVTAWPASTRAAGILQAQSLGIAGTTDDFHRLTFTSGTPGTFIRTVTYQLPFGFYDFDGVGNFANQTAPILHPPSLVGLAPADVAFSFTGQHPTTLTLDFAPGTFAPGDHLRFAADLDGAISDVGGGMGGGAGTLVTVQTYDGQTGAANFTTQTSVESSATVNIVPEPGACALAIAGLALLFPRRSRGHTQTVIAR